MDSQEELVRQSIRDAVDDVYEEEYEHLFPDIYIPAEMTEEIDVGDSIYDSDEFIKMVVDTYMTDADQVKGRSYKPPRLTALLQEIWEVYEQDISYMLEDLEEDGEDIDGLKEAINPDSHSIEMRIAEVLDYLELVYIQEEVVMHTDFRTGEKKKTIVRNKITNSSANNLFDFSFKNILIDKDGDEYVRDIQAGYNNMLRMCVDNVW